MTDSTFPARAAGPIVAWPIVGLLALMAGCQAPSKVTQPNPGPTAAAPITTAAPAGTGAATPAAGSATPQSAVSTVDLASTRSAAAVAGTAALAAPTQRVVYFDFDSFAIKDDFKPMLEGHARVLARDNGRRLVIEGHTDERGGREYNLALGQKRAEAVVRSLTLLGVADRQLEAVSFGEERPAAAGATETAWAQNRRAELKDR